MLKHHHHTGAPVSTRCRHRRPHLHQPPSSRSVPVEVGIIPGNRFFLLPLKKVTALVRPHTPCRESSATKTKPCIVSKPKPASSRTRGAEIHRHSLLQEFYARSQAHSKSSRLIAKQRRRRSAVAKASLSPVREQASGVAEQELLLEYERLLWNDGPRVVETRNCGFNRSRAKDPSIFTWSETTLLETYRGASPTASSTQMLQELNLHTATKTNKKKRSNSFSNASDIDLVLYRSSRKTHTKSRFSVSPSIERELMLSGGRSFGRNNRVSPSSLSHGQQLHPGRGPGNDSATSFSAADHLETPMNKNRRISTATSFGKVDDLETPRNKNRSCNSRATSFGKVDELGTPRFKKRSCNSRATSFGKVDELVTPRSKNRSTSRGSFTTSTKADELVPEVEKTPWNKDRSDFRDNNCKTSFSKADELVTLCDKSISNSRGNSTTSFDTGDEIVKPCDKNSRRKSRSHRRTSFGKADEIQIRDKKRRNFSFWGCSHQIRSCSPFLCSITNKNDLPVGPSPLKLSRRLQSEASVAQGEV